jgi:hypothetical protein
MKTNWIWNGKFDMSFIIGPQFIGVILLLLFQPLFQTYSTHIPLAAWVFLILCIDVSHVYSTLFRTYFDRTSWQSNTNTLLLIPFSGLLIGVFLYAQDPLLFWRALAYLAVFHFIRQQYGFVRLYSRKTQQPSWSSAIDKMAVYGSTLIPILIWHCSGMKNFNWFVDNDFIYFENASLKLIFQCLFFALLGLYLLKETYHRFHGQEISLPKFLFMTGTALSWYTGIVLCNGDLAFTTLNVVAHGIPYIALVWFYGVNNYRQPKEHPVLSKLFSLKFLLLFIGALFLFAYLEEGIWDGLVWREHQGLFRFFYSFGQANEDLMIILVPLLTLPQFTHYVLDGFIWKIGEENFYWKKLNQ